MIAVIGKPSIWGSLHANALKFWPITAIPAILVVLAFHSRLFCEAEL